MPSAKSPLDAPRHAPARRPGPRTCPLARHLVPKCFAITILYDRSGKVSGPNPDMREGSRLLQKCNRRAVERGRAPGSSDELQLDDLVEGGQAMDLACADAVEDHLHRAATGAEVHGDVAALAGVGDGDELAQLVGALDD